MYKILVAKSKGRPLGRPKCRWEVRIRIELREFGLGSGWTKLAQSRDWGWVHVNEAMNLWVLVRHSS